MLVIKYMFGFFFLLVMGNIKIRFYVLKMLLNLFENFVMIKVLFSVKVMLEFMEFFKRKEINDNI